MAVLGLDHVSVSCADLDRSLAFYGGLLGIPVLATGELRDGAAGEIAGLHPLHARYADLDLGGGQVLELLEFVEPRGTERGQQVQDPGSGHLSLAVDDIDAEHRRLVGAGVEVRSEPVTVTEGGAWSGVRCLYASDPDGHTVELIERPA